MTEEEERIITQYYSEEVKFSELAGKMVNRTANWVKEKYRMILRDKLNILK